MDLSESVNKAVSFISNLVPAKATTAVILGSGLGGFGDQIEVIEKIMYTSIPGFPEPTVAGHGGNLLFGKINGEYVWVMQGRFHFYEGHDMQTVTFPVRVLAQLGVKTLLLSNASGGVNPQYKVGDLMVLDDHINLMSANPLTGSNNDAWGPRFPDMSRPYDPELIDEALMVAGKNNFVCHKGVYAAVTGPCYETRAEYKYIRTIGADAVGMSTVPEVIVARHMGLRCFAISVITDLGGMEQEVELTHDEVVKVAGEAESKVTHIIRHLISKGF